MIITDAAIADGLAVACVERCLVLAARHWHEVFTGPCTAPLECCRCAMPSTADGVCVMCGHSMFRPMRAVSRSAGGEGGGA